MVKYSTKEKKAAKLAAQKQADIKLYRLIVEFVLAMAALFLTIAAGNNEIFVLYKVMPIVLVVTGVLFGLSAVYFCVKRSKNADESESIITSVGIFGNAASLFMLSAAFYLFMSAELVISALIALIVVYIAYNIEGAGFFVYSAVAAASYISVNLALRDSYYVLGNGIALAALVLSFAIPAASIVLAAVILKKHNGVSLLGINVSGKNIALALIITAVIALCAAVLAIVYPAASALAVYAMLAVYFVITVIGIFKMM